MHWLRNHLPDGVPIWRLTPQKGCLAVPLK
jgi:hypothetical protein